MTNTSSTLRRAVRFSLAAVASTAAGSLAYAQTPPAAGASEIPQEVVVTGSRIQQLPNEVSISPVTSVTSVEIAQSGLIRAEDLLNSLPQVTADQSSGLSISSNGTAAVNLRDLGAERTLVLVNGRRMNPGAGGGYSSAADINQIPSDLVERVDVLTGGASAVYGADAVAGVVNFVLDTHFEGVKVDANYGFNNHQNNSGQYASYLANSPYDVPSPPSTVNTGITKDVSVVLGSNFADGKGNATAYFTYLNAGAAVGNQFDHAACTLNGGSTVGSGPVCGGSSTSAGGRLLYYGLNAKGTSAPLIGDFNIVNRAGGGFTPWNSGDSYNYGALSYFQRPQERYTAGAFVNYDVNDNAKVYSEFMFTRNTSQAQYGPSGDFNYPIQISCGNNAYGVNPLLTSAQRGVLCNPANVALNEALAAANGTPLPTGFISPYVLRRNVEGGGRQDNYYSDSFREVLGVKGKIADGWTYDVYGQIGITTLGDIEGNFLGVQQMQNALNVVTNPTTGAPTCLSNLTGQTSNCVPWNIWSPGGVTPAALQYLTVPSTYQNKATEYIVDASATGELGQYGIKVPTAATGAVINIGSEYREENFSFAPDYIYGNGLAGGGGSATLPIAGGFHVAELFTEFKLPIVDDKPGFYSLSAEAGYRYSSYTSGFDTNTFKLGLEWAPIQDVKLRGSYNRAIRAPNVEDLFAPNTIGSGGVADPCWGSTPQYSAAQCALTGVTASEYGKIAVNSAAQINTQTGGNVNLQPEVADTYSFGVILQPSVIPNWIVSIDYFDIKIKNTISSLTSTTILDDCATGILGQSTCTSLIHRGPTGSLWLTNANYVTTTTQNIGDVSTAGYDLTSHYHLDIGRFGKLAFNLTGTYTQSLITEPVPGGGSFDCVGLFGATCGNPVPKWRHVFTTNWETPWAGLDLLLKWRYIGLSDVDSSSSNSQLAGPYYTQFAHIPAYNYLDFSASMPIAPGVTARIGVNNIADKNPPLVLNGSYADCPSAACNDNTFPGTYDTLGRYIYAHVTAKF